LAHQPCNLVRLTMDVVRDCVPRAMEKRIDIGYEGAGPDTDGVAIMGNATLLTEMVRNMVDNAINYTAERPEQAAMITVRVLLDPFSRVLMVQVEDTGPGIPAAERELVFQPFYRALGTEADGSGLGLPIVMEIARQHQATVKVEDSRPGQTPPGCCFTVRFNQVLA
jgi:two-component system sensor histidine kinase TctE